MKDIRDPDAGTIAATPKAEPEVQAKKNSYYLNRLQLEYEKWLAELRLREARGVCDCSPSRSRALAES